MTEKSPEAFRTISEVADELDLPQHVLRFWETRFSQIKPLKRGGGRRYYRPEDVNLLKGIRHLLYGEGYTIKGVQRILKEQGVRHVAGVWDQEEAEEAEDDTCAGGAEEYPEPVAQPQRPAPRVIMPQVAPPQRPAPTAPQAVPQQSAPYRAPVAVQPAPAPAAAPPVVAPPVIAPQPRLSQDDLRQLKAALFELIECKRLLEDAVG
jgi:DNA-binding transcriptional MerR regulator